LLLDTTRQKVLSKSSLKLKIEILLVESKRRPECGFYEYSRTCYYRKALLIQASNDEHRVVGQRTWRMKGRGPRTSVILNLVF